ncbi:DUF5397 family protein [Methylobacterium trifolii]|uniref:Uncharacterized protein n=1 Tax=Methylobacterium trifolii TaxID=1003092 RepID=A0ABQ4U0A9_9HYPH|nr:DUF5397 family protein [Methylobacterium trifolii]GJE59285.1 hypothetical protein MPOCJGCO_1373 [Methylobacterium trifolii]
MAHRESPAQPEPRSLVGTWRRFGEVGPAYEVVGISDASPKGDLLMRVRVLETGEELDYRLGDILADPTER